jgi:hypothetical protein
MSQFVHLKKSRFDKSASWREIRLVDAIGNNFPFLHSLTSYNDRELICFQYSDAITRNYYITKCRKMFNFLSPHLGR